MNLSALFTPASISARWTEAASNRIPYLGEALFPDEKKMGLDLSWIKGANGLPISLMPSAFDAMVTFRDRIGVEKIDTEMPFFREAYKIKEKDRQEILKAQDTNSPYVKPILAQIYKDIDNLVEGAKVASERERMQLLFAANGNVGIAIVANGVQYVYNYDPNGAWKATNYFELAGQSVWTDATHADPFNDFDVAKQAILDKTGEKSAIAIMNTITFNKLMAMNVVKNRYLTKANVAIGYFTKSEILKVVEDTAELRIVLYDKQFRDENKATKKFVPDGYVAIVPNAALGNTWYGTTPEEADLMSAQKSNAEVSIIGKGIAVTQEVTTHPVNTNTIVSQIVLPSYERMDDVALLKVY